MKTIALLTPHNIFMTEALCDQPRIIAALDFKFCMPVGAQ